ncbi:MAG: rhodanese-related sulfurtransferase [Alphaproteobacteria bacterium]|nr:MAG: rhodanese-related sulfurtransferase [Alphaproteobacteria bacterium]
MSLNQNLQNYLNTNNFTLDKYIISTFYKFLVLENYKELKIKFDKSLSKTNIKGTILLAKEGVNGTIAGSESDLKKFFIYIDKFSQFKDITPKFSSSNKNPFLRMKVRIKKEIVTIGIPEVSPSNLVGKYLNVEEWNEFLNESDSMIIDTRNNYEVSIGTFKNSINPKIKSFRDFPKWVQKNLIDKKISKKSKIGMFCTGGIRCEKSTSYLKQLGFENVFHLDGGILKYLENVKSDENEWKGECFVFDYRVSLNDSLEKGEYDMCYACRMPLSKENKKNKHFLKGQSCEYCYDQTTIKQKKRFNEREKQIKLLKVKNLKHLGPKD